jgi:hypothetical protein
MTELEPHEVIRQRAGQLRSAAAIGLTDSHAVVAIATALGQAAAALGTKHDVTLNDVLDVVTNTVREEANIAMGNPPHFDDGSDLTEHQFTALTQKLIRTAIANGTPHHDAITALAKALGIMATFTARRSGRSIEELVVGSQQAVETFAHHAETFMLENNVVDPSTVR